MDSISIKGETGFIKIVFDEGYWFPEIKNFSDWYDVKTLIEVKSSDFHVNSTFWTCMAELRDFFQQITECNTTLQGTAILNAHESDIEITVTYGSRGQVNIKGKVSDWNNELKFEFLSDQSYIKNSIDEHQLIDKKYSRM